jgi:hypothetical protein
VNYYFVKSPGRATARCEADGRDRKGAGSALISFARICALGRRATAWCVTAAWLLGACARDGTLELRIVTPAGQNPFAGAVTARLTLATSPPTVRDYAIDASGQVQGEIKPAPTGVNAAITVELLDTRGEVVARGRVPEVPLSSQLSGYVEVLVGRVNQFAALPVTLPAPASRPMVIALSNSAALIAGGQNQTAPIADASVYNLYGILFESVGKLVTPRAAATILPGTGGRFAVLGGLVPGEGAPSPTETLEVFDASTASFSGGQGGGGARAGATASPFPDTADRWLVSGGSGPGDAALASALVFDTSTGALTSTASGLVTARKGHTSTPVQTASGPRVLILGGQDAGPDAELFAPEPRTFEAMPAALGARRDHSATLLSDGRVLVAGGRDGASARADLLLFDPQSACTNPADCPAFAPARGSGGEPIALITGRSGHAAIVLASNRVLVFGGRGGDGAALASAELLVYDPATQRITRESSPSLVAARADFGAVLLSTQQVLVVGGVDGTGAPLSTAELFIPR